MIGRILGHYRIVEKLGEGGMGIVYKAHDLHLDRSVALKILPPEQLADPERKQRFAQEARAASALNHPNIVTIHDISSDAGTDFIAMEFVPGHTLDQLIPPGGMGLNQALKIALQVAEALAAAHAIGIVHRDVKPANIIVSDGDRVKVMDFGLAKLQGLVAEPELSAATAMTALRTEAGRIVGTLHYMSPEQAEGRVVDERSDIFSFGSLLYEMLCGQRPFQGDSAITTLAAIVEKEPLPLPAGLPPSVQKLLERCLRKDPSRRYQHMADVAVELRDLVEQSGSRTRPARAKLWSVGGWRWLAGAGAVIAIAAGAWFGLTLRQRPLPPPSLVTLTAYPGEENAPALSPDGKQVAFSWNGGKGNNTDIYVQLVGDTRASRLTTDEHNEVSPCWSPDGRRIAFIRVSKPLVSRIVITSALPGGEEQQLGEMAPLPAIDGGLSWSPDGQHLLFALGSSPRAPMTVPGLAWGLYLVPVAGGEPRRLTSPPAPLVDWYAHISPDGSSLAYFRANVGQVSGDLYVLPLTRGYQPAGTPRKLTPERTGATGVAWTSDGAALVYGGQIGFLLSRLYRVPADGSRPAERIELAGLSASFPTISDHRLAFARNLTDYDIWRFDVGRGATEPLIRSSFSEWSPQLSPDGRKVAFTSNRNESSSEVWTADADGSNWQQISRGPGVNQGSPRWSPDGSQLAFDSQAKDRSAHIYIVNATGGPARELTAAGTSGAQPSWSRDGRWIYFGSNRTGRFEIWRCPSNGGTPEQCEQMSTTGGWVASESTDGRTLYYNDLFSPTPFGGGLHAKPLDGGPERVLAQRVRDFAVIDKGIFYVGAAIKDGKMPLLFYDFKSQASREIGRVAWSMGLAASPDGKSLLYSATLATGKDLMLIENFR